MTRAPLLLALALLGCSATDGPIKAPTECRGAEPGVEAPGAPVVEVTTNSADPATDITCTGVVVGRLYVLTAGHCVVDRSSWTAKTVDGQVAQSLTGVTRFPADDNHYLPTHPDVGILRLEEPGLRLKAYATLGGPAAYLEGAMVNFRSDGVSTLALHEHRAQLFPGSDMQLAGHYYPRSYLSDMLATFGDSGTPVFTPGTYEVVGLLSGSRPCGNVIARIDLEKAWIEENMP